MLTIVCTEDTIAADFVGDYVKGLRGDWVWQDGPLTIAMEQGLVLYVDEIARARQKQLGVLFSAMDGRRELTITTGKPRTVKAASGFAVAASANISMASGDLDDALKRRFTLALEVRTDYTMARDQLGIDPKLVNAAENLENRRLSNELGWAPQMAHLVNAHKNIDRIGMPAALGNLVNSAPIRDRDIVADVLTKSMGRRVERLVLA
jgi:MoxR-like ATPase